MPLYPPSQFMNRALFAVLADAACFIAAATASWFMLALPFPPLEYGVTVVLGAMGAFATLYYANAYGLRVLGSARSTLESVMTVMGVALVVAVVVFYFVESPAGAVLEGMANTAAVYFPLLLLERGAFRFISSRSCFSRRLLLVGTSDLSIEIARIAADCHKLGTNIAGFLSDELIYERATIEGVPVLGKIHEIEKIVDHCNINHIVVASKGRDDAFPAEELLIGKLRGVTVESGISFYEKISGRVYVRDLRPSYLIFSEGFRVGHVATFTKRAIDLSVSVIGIVLSLPLLLLIAAAIRMDSKGPIFYRQERVGEGGQLFHVLKLRSMRHDAEAQSGPVWTQQSDDRVTRVGRILRKARLDELPQLWNVLKGEMALVGPRPERPEFVDSLSQRYPYFSLRSSLRPGVTGWAQIRKGYVNEIEGFEEKLALDIYYMKYRSTTMDLLILWKTAKTVLLMSGV